MMVVPNLLHFIPIAMFEHDVECAEQFCYTSKESPGELHHSEFSFSGAQMLSIVYNRNVSVAIEHGAPPTFYQSSEKDTCRLLLTE